MGQEIQTLTHKMEAINLEERADEKVEDTEKFHNDKGLVLFDPVKMNKTLEWDYIIKHEPYNKLPVTYFPLPELNHRPPRFIYGFGFSYHELTEYAIKLKLSPTREEVDNDPKRIMHFPFKTIMHFRITIREEFGVCSTFTSPYSFKAKLVIVLCDNYFPSPHPGPRLVRKAIKRMEEMLREGGIERKPKWYISMDEMLDGENSTEGYNAPADFTRYFPAQAV